MWSILQGAVTGPYHIKNNDESQDYSSYLIQNNITVIAVADGAGSKSLSFEGAVIVVESLLDYLSEKISQNEISEQVMEDAIYYAREKLLEEEEYREMGCTLSAVLLTDDQWIAGVVGDAFAVIHNNKEDHIFIQPESKFEFANLTELITSIEINPLIVSGGEVLGASVSSDGLQNSTITNGVPTATVWNSLVKKAVQGNLDLQSFLHFMENKQIIDDDTTITMAVRK